MIFVGFAMSMSEYVSELNQVCVGFWRVAWCMLHHLSMHLLILIEDRLNQALFNISIQMITLVRHCDQYPSNPSQKVSSAPGHSSDFRSCHYHL